MHTGIGKPLPGVEGREEKSKRLGSKTGSVAANQRDPMVERGLHEDHEKGGKANARTVEERAGLMDASERMPETAETVAAEAPSK